MDAVIGEEPVTGVYDVNHIHYEIGDMYSKGSIMLHTFRNVLNDDVMWIRLLHDIQNKFRYNTLTADELDANTNKQTGKDYQILASISYLHYVELPELHLQPSCQERSSDKVPLGSEREELQNACKSYDLA